MMEFLFTHQIFLCSAQLRKRCSQLLIKSQDFYTTLLFCSNSPQCCFQWKAAGGYITCKTPTADRQNYSWGIYWGVFTARDFPQVSAETRISLVASDATATTISLMRVTVMMRMLLLQPGKIKL